MAKVHSTCPRKGGIYHDAIEPKSIAHDVCKRDFHLHSR
ncbi:unnamed protein product [Callosobruchus maculatus]|uniref:Uncharacterized protein n=1 Tax=Callosobruchus maculatus TaxID=64391 RepID=A0A653CXV1_CALMS|nr:unnamed protein product [Callosobruchus maculatus]